MIITFKGKLKAALSVLTGIYTRYAKDKFWVQKIGGAVIRYDSKLGRWNFTGTHFRNSTTEEFFSTYKTWIYSEDHVAGPQLATNWKYDDGRKIESDDILVDSLEESGTYRMIH